MNLTYQATLEDISEPAIRHYLRSKSAKKNRIQSTVVGAVLSAAAMAFVFREREASQILVFSCFGLIAGAALNYFTYQSTVRKRITKHIRLETEGKLPSTTSYLFADNQLICDSLGASITLNLIDLTSIHEDAERMEIVFGDVGLCTIPLRAFETAEQKCLFIDKLHGKTNAAADG